MKVLCAMSGGVDSSVAAAELLAQGHDVVGVTMRLWGGESDTGCCSIADVDDARRVAQQLGIDHLVFNFTEDFDAHVVAPVRRGPCRAARRRTRASSATATSSSRGSASAPTCSASTPIATGHHARIVDVDGALRIARGADPAQGPELRRPHAARSASWHGRCSRSATCASRRCGRGRRQLGLRTASKPDSQDVCFIPHVGRARAVPRRPDPVLARRRSSTRTAQRLGEVRGGRAGDDRTATRDRPAGRRTEALRARRRRRRRPARGGRRRGRPPRRARSTLRDIAWSAEPLDVADRGDGAVQRARRRRGLAIFDGGTVVWDEPQRRVAPGQSVVLYDPTRPLGARRRHRRAATVRSPVSRR